LVLCGIAILPAGCGDHATPVYEHKVDAYEDGTNVDAWVGVQDTGAADTYFGVDTTVADTNIAHDVATDTGPVVPTTVRVEILSAVIGPGKSDGTQWDGNGAVDAGLVAWLADAAGLPATKIIEKVAEALFQAMSKPDPIGFAEIDRGHGWAERQDFLKTQDSFQPNFEPSPVFSNVVLASTSIKVTLLDSDLAYDDDIGVVVLPAFLLEQVWLVGDAWVNTAGQTNGQLLLLRVVVR